MSDRRSSDAAVLTIVAADPGSGTFRPPYTGQAQNNSYNISSVDRSLLLNLNKVSTTPDINTIADYFERPWIDFLGGWNGRHIHPDNNMPEFAREMAIYVSTGALMLNLDFTETQKEKLLIRYIQLGLDFWGIVQAGGTRNWMPDGAHAGGRKWPILFAGIMLNNAELKNIGTGDGSGIAYFGEDAQTFYVTQSEIDISNSAAWTPDPRSQYAQSYTSAFMNMPEWGIRHATEPNRSDAAWDTPYRHTAAIGWPGYVLTARLMGVMNLWGASGLI